MEVTAAGEWIEDIKGGIVDDEWFGPIAHSLANPSPRPPPFTASAKERKLCVSSPQFYLEENSLLWLRGDLERKQAEKKATEMKKDGEKVEITVREHEKEKIGKAEKEGEGKAEKRGRVYSKDDAVSNPPRGPRHSSRGTLRCGPNVLTHERPVFLEANMARYPVLRSGLRLMLSNQSPERETQGPPTTTSCSRRLLAENRH